MNEYDMMDNQKFEVVEDDDETSTDISKALDCMICGSDESVSMDKNHVHSNKELKINVVRPAMVCSECLNVFYELPVFKELKEMEEHAKGNTWIRYEARDGQLFKYSLH